jgi:hypothetical protein
VPLTKPTYPVPTIAIFINSVYSFKNQWAFLSRVPIFII